jgi:fumarate reductase subunit D
MNEVSAENADSIRNSLYRIGGVAALICALMYVITLGVYIPAYRVGPPPATMLEWFMLFQTNPLTGLFFLGLADIVIMILWGPLALAIYDALKQSGKTWARIAISFVFVGMAVYLATNTAFSMLSLSHKYAAAITEVEKTVTLAAGQALISVSEGTGGQYTGMPLVWLAGLILSVIMLRSKTFSKATAWVGILGLGLLEASMPFAGYTTTGPTTAAVSTIIAVTYIGGGLLSLVWYILVGLRLLKLGQPEGKAHPQQS